MRPLHSQQTRTELVKHNVYMLEDFFKCRILLKPVTRGVDSNLHVPVPTMHEQAQSNRACNILQFCCFGLSLGVLIFLYFFKTIFTPIWSYREKDKNSNLYITYFAHFYWDNRELMVSLLDILVETTNKHTFEIRVNIIQARDKSDSTCYPKPCDQFNNTAQNSC